MASIKSIGLATKHASGSSSPLLYAYLTLSGEVPATKFYVEFDQHPNIISSGGISELIYDASNENPRESRHLISFGLLTTSNKGTFIGDLNVSLRTVHNTLIASGSVPIALII